MLSEVWSTSPPYADIASTARSGVTFSTTMTSAEVPGWTMSRTRSRKLWSMPALSIPPKRAPIAPPSAIPMNGMNRIRPNRPPMIAPQSAPVPALGWFGVSTLVLPSAVRTTSPRAEASSTISSESR